MQPHSTAVAAGPVIQYLSPCTHRASHSGQPSGHIRPCHTLQDVEGYAQIAARKFMFFEARKGRLRFRDLLASQVWQEFSELKHYSPDDPSIGNNWFSQQVGQGQQEACMCSAVHHMPVTHWYNCGKLPLVLLPAHQWSPTTGL